MRRVRLFDIPFDNLTLRGAVKRIMTMCDGKGPSYVATANVDFVVNTYGWRPKTVRNPPLLEALQGASLVLADGMPIVWLSRILRRPLKQRVTGADLVPAVAKAAASKEKSLYLLGGPPGVGRKAAKKLQKKYEGLSIAGIASPAVTSGTKLTRRDRELVSKINAARPDILLIGFGNPKQELWFFRVKSLLKVPVSIGVGGSFAFSAGVIPRAPLWVRRAGFEWLHRLIHEPVRLFHRYVLGGVRFSSLTLFELLK